MAVRSYYSLIEAADMISGDHENQRVNEKIVKDFIHLAANGNISLIVLIPYEKTRSLKEVKISYGMVMFADPITKNPTGQIANGKICKKFTTLDLTRSGVFYVSTLDMAAFEAAITGKPIGEWPKHQITRVCRHCQHNGRSDEFMLLSPELYIDMSPGNLCVGSKAITDYQAQIRLTEYPVVRIEAEHNYFETKPLSVEPEKSGQLDEIKGTDGLMNTNKNAPAFKVRKHKNQTDALVLLSAAIEEMEKKSGKTPSWTELAAYVLSGTFEHSNINESCCGEGVLISNRYLILANGSKLNRKAISKCYTTTIYPKYPKYPK
ncbi:MAG: hypothetical protein ABL884_07075, partial [Methyloglobulus sp.]